MDLEDVQMPGCFVVFFSIIFCRKPDLLILAIKDYGFGIQKHLSVDLISQDLVVYYFYAMASRK